MTPEAETWLCGDCDRAGKVSTQPERALGEHTPTPWRVGDHPQDGSGTSWRQILADTQPFGPVFVGSALEVDAQLIVTAVNNHERAKRVIQVVIKFSYLLPTEVSDEIARFIKEVR